MNKLVTWYLYFFERLGARGQKEGKVKTLVEKTLIPVGNISGSFWAAVEGGRLENSIPQAKLHS